MCTEGGVGILVDASVTEVESFEGEDIISDVVEKVKTGSSGLKSWWGLKRGDC